MSQQDSNVAGLAQAVGATSRRRSSRLQTASNPGDPAPSSSGVSKDSSNPGRFDTAKEIKITANANTDKADKKAVKAFMSFLKERHSKETDDLSQAAPSMDQQELKKLLADYITRVRWSARTASTWRMPCRTNCPAYVAAPAACPAYAPASEACPACGPAHQTRCWNALHVLAMCACTASTVSTTLYVWCSCNLPASFPVCCCAGTATEWAKSTSAPPCWTWCGASSA